MSDIIHSTEWAAVQQPLASGLYLVSTPIGHLQDITLRALHCLKQADIILCEDKRVTRVLLNAYGLHTKLLPYHDHSDDSVRETVLEKLAAGHVLALVSDAGTPMLSDPGYKLVQAALDAGHKVIPVPGASALLPALQLSGLPSDRFLFAGFTPAKTSARQSFFAELAQVPATLVFYESPHRITDSIADAYAVFGDRPVALARELTKMFEECKRGTLGVWASDPSSLGVLKGEMVLVIGPPLAVAAGADDITAQLRQALKTNSVKEAVALVAGLTGAPRKQVYAAALALQAE